MSNAFLVLMLLLSIIPSFIGCAPTDPLTDTVIKADLIVLGTITDNRSEVVMVKTSENTTGKFAYTLFTLSIEKVLKGDPSIKKVIIQVEGGYLGDGLYQLLSPGVRSFRTADHILVGLIHLDGDRYTKFGINYRKDWFGPLMIGGYDSVFWIRGSATSREHLELIMGRVCRALRINGIPNSLNEPCTEPADWPASPPKR
jgi:hypothetical protein